METLRRIMRSLRNIVFGGTSPTVDDDAGAAEEPPVEAAGDAASDIFAPRHSYREDVRFAKVTPDDSAEKKREDFRREGDGFQEQHTETRLIMVTGAIVEPSAVVLKCRRCGGYDSEKWFCVCGIGICRICKRELSMPNGQIQVLCPEHYLAALERWDTWQSYDLRKQP